jgi:hypothetical protein
MLECGGIYIPPPAFPHGQLYVASSQASSFYITIAIAAGHSQLIQND